MDGVTFDMLLHPEVLPTKTLHKILEERCVKIDHLDRTPREKLLEIFRKFCMPQEQREYRDTGRGKILNETRRQKSGECSSSMEVCSSGINNMKLNKNGHTPSADLMNDVKRIKISCEKQPLKRKLNGADSQITLCNNSSSCPAKKHRKKITWP